jgi:hypothetical protein
MGGKDKAPAGRKSVAGCPAHGTPAGQRCEQCARQGELFSRTDAARQSRKR